MGLWREVYERDWRTFASRALADAFGDAPPATTAEDRAYLAALLGSLGVRGHVPLSASLSSHDTQPLDELLSDADASTSYVYATPRKATPERATHFFPCFSEEDFLTTDHDGRRESASQTLRLRMAGVSPIAPMREHSPMHFRRLYCEQQQQQQPGMRVGQDADSMLSTPRTGSPSVPESQDAAVLRSGDEEFQTPRPSGNVPCTPTGLRERRSALRELSVRASRVDDLDESMHSMNLSDDDIMIVDNPGDAVGAAHEIAHMDRSQAAAHVQDRVLVDEHDRVPKVLNFSSDSEDEEMEYQFDDGQPDGEPDDDDQDEGMDLTYDDHVDDNVNEEAEREKSFAVEIKVEPASEDFELLNVVPAPAALHVTVLEQHASRPNMVDASRESCDSVDSNQGSVHRRPVFQTRLPLEVEYRSTTDRRRRTQRRRSLLLKDIGPYRAPEFRVELAPYQQRAVAWMQAREAYPKQPDLGERPNRHARITNKIRGGILADEMGLGKTVCCIGLICESLKESRQKCQREAAASGSSIPRIKPPTLIITPLSILGQWASEIRQKTNLSVITYHGSSRKTYRTAMDFMGADVVLSTYDTLRLKECKVGRISNRINDDDEGDRTGGQATTEEGEWRTILRNTAEDRRSFMGSKLHQLSWHRVILDESHLITNASCARARAAYSLQSKRRWCVTGTPIQNSSSDLVSLVGFLGITHDMGAELQNILPHIMLRRLKATVDTASREPILALPEKIEEHVELLFANELEEAFYTLLHRSTKKQVMQYLQGRDAQPQFMHVFELLLRLRQTCNSYALITQDPISEVRGSGTLLIAEASASMTPGSKSTRLIHRVEARYASGQVRGAEVLPKSTKLCALVSHLKAVRAKKEKALVISQWTGFLDLIGESLESHNASDSARAISFGKLDGRMSARERDQTIAWFQQDKRLDVLLISLRTGGMGVNLTAASHVFIMEPSWNPSVESQAIDRAHRFGQERPVRVVRFIMKNTIEERVVELQKKKRELAQNLLGDASTDAASRGQEDTRLTRAELRQLFTQGQSDEW